MKKITGLDVANKLGLKDKYLEKKQKNIDESDFNLDNNQDNKGADLKSVEQDFLNSDFIDLPM